MQNIRAAAVQMISSTDPDANTAAMKRLVRQAAEQGADWVLLPEYWPLMGRNDTDKLAFAEPLVSGRFGETRYARFQTALSETAAECGVVLFGGTVPLQSPDAGKVMNTMLVYGRDGAQIGLYHKMHLFGFSGLGERYAEADTISAGGDVPELSADEVPLAAGICYDLRFPEFFRAQRPFDVLLLPAAFTYTTGRAHWELLLRARAVENQCYVVAAAHFRPQHDYRPVGRSAGRFARRRGRRRGRFGRRAAAKRAHQAARVETQIAANYPLRPSEKPFSG